MAQPHSPTSPRSPKTSYGYQPLCFHKDIFSSPHFNVDSFIADCRKRVPLESVRNDLRDYFSSLENELVELINKDYTDFVNLSSNLAGIDEVLNQLREPLSEIKEEAKGFHDRIEGVISTTSSQLETQQGYQTQTSYLQLFISLSGSVDKLGLLLSNPDRKSPQPSIVNTPTNQPFTNATYLDRLANEYNMLRFYLSQAHKFPSPQTLLDHFTQKITVLVTELDREVSRNFRASISSSTSTTSTVDQIGACLRLYSALNKPASAYTIFRELRVRPAVSKIVTVANLEKGSRGTCEGLKGILDSLLAFIKEECCPFLECIRNFTCSKYDFLSNSIWIEIEETIYSKIGKIYAPGIPEIFHQNYKACLSFLNQLETLACYDLEGLTSFRSHSSYQAFERRWNTSVYFQLRFTEIASKVEAALSQQQQLSAPQQSPNKPSSAYGTSSEPSFLLVGSTVLWRELIRIWSPNVFLLELTRQFVKLTLQLLSRYSSWVYASYAPSSSSPIPSSPPPVAATGDSLKNSAAISLAENVDEPAVAIWSKLVPGAYAHLYHDLIVLVSNLQTENKAQDIVPNGHGGLLAAILSALQDNDCDVELVSTIRLSLNSASSSLLVHQSYLANAITSNLTKKAIDSLQPLLGVTATYRLTDKRLPTRANYYVDDVVAVLHTFYQAHASYIPLPILKDWEHKVLEDVTTRYEEMVTETLHAAHKAEMLLNKMVKKKTTTQTGISDIDKISLQLYLDVSQYGQLLKSKLSLDGSAFPPYVSLLAKVQDGAKFKNLVSESV